MAKPPRATRFTDGGSAAAWRMLGRHQIGAMVATVVDFATMILLVQWLGVRPVVATAVSAPSGAVANFMLGRTWIFKRRAASAAPQALRYALVSAASAGLNTLGEHAMHDVARVQYVIARAIVAVAVSLLWNFPMQRYFVFPTRTAA